MSAATAFTINPSAIQLRSSGPAVSGLGRPLGARPARLPARSLLRMQESSSAAGVVKEDDDGTAEFFGVDAEGNAVKLTVAAKEKLYLDALAAFHNDGTQLLGDEEYSQLKEDLEFEGSSVSTMTREEVKFMVAANRWQEGKSIMPDDEFDALRRKLKAANSPAVVHKMPTCKVDTQKCKADMVVDKVKTNILYLPAVSVVTIVWTEISYWASRAAGQLPDPIISLILNSPFIALFSWAVTQYILFQRPQVMKVSCPRCTTEQNVYFGDILFVNGKVSDQVTTTCVNNACKASIVADKEKMICTSDLE
eukprot:CAMPEP_0184312214 /NCGR_PEP_ID=MMETSP1049-20130417/47956_1 /TAXON_ID=77928 /ORGANISM="Proteomonas sulcata, Strain CCMP704" /LENGTH=307 /DNA_ID=CAMNT_0026628177 /DNA_START=134 /DNA_END=1057 /DNA_ORIENTATION=-